MSDKTEPKLICTPAPTFAGVVEITPQGTGEGHHLDVEFKHMGKKAAGVWLSGLKGSDQPAADALCEIIASVNGFAATPAMFEQLMDDFPRPFADLVEGWSDYLMRGRLKNSPRPPAGSSTDQPAAAGQTTQS